jgi:hypothetical protein
MITTLDEYIDALTVLRTRLKGDTIILAFDRVITPMVASNLYDDNLDIVHEAIDEIINAAS